MQLSKSLPTKMVTGALTILMLAITSEPSTPQELTKVNVSIIPIIDAAPLFAARTFGYFKEVGLEIDVKPTIGGAQGLTALAAGDVDVVLSNIVSTTLAVHQGLKIRVIAPITLTGAEPPDLGGVVVAADLPIKNASELVGKRMAVNARNNIDWLYARAWIDKKSGESAKVTFLEVPFPQMNDAVTGGHVDAAFVVEPFLGSGIASNKVRLLGWPRNDVQKHIPVAQYVTSQKLIDEKPDVVERFVQAYKRGVDWMNANRGSLDAANVIASYSRLQVATIMKLQIPEFPKSVNIGDVNKTLALMKKYGLIERDIDFASVLYKTAQ